MMPTSELLIDTEGEPCSAVTFNLSVDLTTRQASQGQRADELPRRRFCFNLTAPG